MSDTVNVLNNVGALYITPTFAPFTGVKLWCNDTNFVFSGNEIGRVLEADLPWATQEIADNVLASIVGFEYQPFSAQNALLDPAAELGDGVSVGGVYSVLAVCNTNFNSMCAANISAPSDEEIDHEYHYTRPEKRMERRMSKMTAELRVMDDSIQGIVKDVEGNKTEFEQTAEEINQRITNAEDEISEITLSIDGISQSVSDAEGMASEALQTAYGFSQRITDAEGTASEALQTANGFSQRITDAEGNINTIAQSLDGVVYESSLADGTTVINGGCIKTGKIDAERIDATNLIVGNGNITNLDVGKLTVNGAAISADNPWDTAYHRNVWVAEGTLGGGKITLDGVAAGYAQLSPDGVVLIYGSDTSTSTITASWKEIIESALGGGYATAVFG